MPTKKTKPELWITPGDPEGIGPEITAKALTNLGFAFASKHKIILVSDPAFFATLPKKFLAWGNAVEWITPVDFPKKHFSGMFSAEAVLLAATAVAEKPDQRALITGPISKKKIQAAGYPFDGHTEILAHVCGKGPATMMLAGPRLRVSLVTTHLPLKEVSKKITAKNLDRTLNHTLDFLHRLGIKKPVIDVLGLNPHAGEQGALGLEEKKIIQPWLKKSQARLKGHAELRGPFSADTHFIWNQQSDAVLAMYHDQGLIPVKMIDFANTINITLGLPLIRTSVDHGTAFDVAGKNVANSESMTQAILMASQLLKP